MKSVHEGLQSLGKTKTDYEDFYNPNLLEVFPNPQQKTPYIIEIVAPEFTCLCPKTGQPDFGSIEIEYSPNLCCLESKSLKLYLFSFRNSGSFHEDVTNTIAEDLFKFLSPHWIKVKGRFNPRGGITFHPVVYLQQTDKI